MGLSTNHLAVPLPILLPRPRRRAKAPACVDGLMVKHCMRKTTYAASGPGIIAQAPCRADLAGGTIDLWPLYLFHHGALTLNFAVNILTTCRVTPLKGKRIHLLSLDTKKEQEFPSFEALRNTRRLRLPLAARL